MTDTKRPVLFWLSENLVFDSASNTSLDVICNAAKSHGMQTYSSSEFSASFVGHLITKLFPNVKISTVKSQATGKSMQSYKNIAIVLNESKVSNDVALEQIPNMVPPNWFLLRKDSTSVTFSYFYNHIKFNGQNPKLQLTFNIKNKILIEMDEIPLQLESFFIPSTIAYNRNSLAALFRCLSVIEPCQGYEIREAKEHSYSESKKCIKTHCTVGDTTKFILKHINCSHCKPLKSYKSYPICKKCEKFISSKRHSLQSLNKENASPAKPTKEDVMHQIQILAPNLHEHQLLLIESQITSSNMPDKRGMRWNKEIISMALSLYNRNPAAYREITIRNWLQLPSEPLIKRYKHAVQQRPGIVKEMMLWMNSEAKRQGLLQEGYYGGLILDEMSIQPDIQIVHRNSSSDLVGLSYTGQDIGQLHSATSGSAECELANHVQQYVFNGLSGFRWPFANFPNTQASPAEIFVTTWLCIEELYKWGFTPLYCCMDGSANNRFFLKMHFPDSNPVKSHMISKWYKNPTKKIVFIMDPCHLLKKIRNSVLSSGFLESHKRLLTVNGKFIIWKMWIDAFQWDQSNNSFKLHNKLCDEHIFPSNAQKMKNKLAFEVLDSDMYNLMKKYSEILNPAGQFEMIGALEFLKHTSFLVSLFTDSRPIKDLSDSRIQSLSESYSWFKAWESQHSCGNDNNKRYKALMTMETREDLDYMYRGFLSLLEICISELKMEIVPSRINSDIIENIFCQERSLYHGATTNPTYNQYRTGINSIILGQTTISKKSNTGGDVAKPFALRAPSKKLKCSPSARRKLPRDHNKRMRTERHL